MSSPKSVRRYPVKTARCQHIKVNGVQCGSPALRGHKICYFHKRHRQQGLKINGNIRRKRSKITLPLLEDAHSIQKALTEVMRLLLSHQIDRRTASLMLDQIQTATSNLSRGAFQVAKRVVTDPDSGAHRPIRATAWSEIEGYESVYYDFEHDEIVLEKEQERTREAEAEIGRWREGHRAVSETARCVISSDRS